MRRDGIVILCLFLAIGLRSLATDFSKMSGYVRQLASQQIGNVALTRGVTPDNHRSVTAFVKINPSSAISVFTDYGCRLYAQYGDISIACIPLDRLSALSEHPAVLRIEASPSCHLMMDTTAIVTGIDKIQQSQLGTFPLMKYTGNGVVVGVMDVGFDLTHPNFYGATSGNYRIGAFWDQLSRDTIGSPLPVGRDFTDGNVWAQLHSIDGLIQTHGTHTLGIATGGGYNSPYRGVACDADICLVSNAIGDDIALIDSADYYKYTSATDALGFKYIFDYADRQGKPCVVSFSEGYPPYLDEIDSLYAAFLDSLCGPGHIIVAAAGNESVASTYAVKPRGVKSAGTFVTSSQESALYRFKYDSETCLIVYGYNSNDKAIPSDTLKLFTSNIPIDSLLTDTLFLNNDTCVVMATRYRCGFDSDEIVNIAFSANKKLKELPPLAIVAEGTDVYVQFFGSSNYAFSNRDVDERWCAAQTSHNIHAPACFPAVISVGSTVHRTGFTNYKGEYKDYSYERVVGQRSSYSSVGPTMSGILKPEVMAPGDNIISSYSSYYIEANPNANDINSDVEHFVFGDRTYAWNANSGTSMATPVVAGIIALWLQAKPDLTPDDIIEVFSRTCRQPDPTLTYPNNQYGYGEINAYQGLLDILGINHIEQIEGNSNLDNPAYYRVYTMSGHLVRVIQGGQPFTSMTLNLAPGVYVVQSVHEGQENRVRKMVVGY